MPSTGLLHDRTYNRVVDERTPWIAVTASGEASVAPDLAVVAFAVTGSGKDLPPTRDDVNRRASAVIARLRELSVDDADIKAPDVSIQPEYDYRRGQRLTGYRVSRDFAVRVRDLTRLGEVLDGIIGSGANEVRGAHMSSSDPAAAEHAALAEAVRAARAKAEVLAATAGVSLGGVLRIEEEPSFDSPPGPLFRAMAAESSDMPTEVVTGDLTVTRRIRAWFLVG
jgi:uncharacterized protein